MPLTSLQYILRWDFQCKALTSLDPVSLLQPGSTNHRHLPSGWDRCWFSIFLKLNCECAPEGPADASTKGLLKFLIESPAGRSSRLPYWQFEFSLLRLPNFPFSSSLIVLPQKKNHHRPSSQMVCCRSLHGHVSSLKVLCHSTLWKNMVDWFSSSWLDPQFCSLAFSSHSINEPQGQPSSPFVYQFSQLDSKEMS